MRADFRQAVMIALITDTSTDLDEIGVAHDDTAYITHIIADEEQWCMVQEQEFRGYQTSACAILQFGIQIGVNLERLRREGLGDE